MNWLIFWSTDWLFGQLVDELVNWWLLGKFVDWLVNWLIIWSTDWLLGHLPNWLLGSICLQTNLSLHICSCKQVAAWNLKNCQYSDIDQNRSLDLDMMISLQLKQTQSTIISAVIANGVGFYHTYTSNLMHWEFTTLVKSFCTGSTSSRRLKSVWRSLILVC